MFKDEYYHKETTKRHRNQITSKHPRIPECNTDRETESVSNDTLIFAQEGKESVQHVVLVTNLT